jgi:hypothetical protein
LISDCSRYETGIQEIIDIFDEIITISKINLKTTITIEEDKGMITLFAKKDEETIFEKRLIFCHQ